MGAGVLYSHGAGTPEATVSGVSAAFNTAGVTAVAVDATAYAQAGGTTPTLTLAIDRQGADGQWYQVWTSGAASLASFPATVTANIGPYSGTYAAGTVNFQAAVFTNQARLRWLFGGAPAPTSVTFSASVIGR